MSPATCHWRININESFPFREPAPATGWPRLGHTLGEWEQIRALNLFIHSSFFVVVVAAVVVVVV